MTADNMRDTILAFWDNKRQTFRSLTREDAKQICGDSFMASWAYCIGRGWLDCKAVKGVSIYTLTPSGERFASAIMKAMA